MDVSDPPRHFLAHFIRKRLDIARQNDELGTAPSAIYMIADTGNDDLNSGPSSEQFYQHIFGAI